MPRRLRTKGATADKEIVVVTIVGLVVLITSPEEGQVFIITHLTISTVLIRHINFIIDSYTVTFLKLPVPSAFYLFLLVSYIPDTIILFKYVT